jgi:hypothetical protein
MAPGCSGLTDGFYVPRSSPVNQDRPLFDRTIFLFLSNCLREILPYENVKRGGYQFIRFTLRPALTTLAAVRVTLAIMPSAAVSGLSKPPSRQSFRLARTKFQPLSPKVGFAL